MDYLDKRYAKFYKVVDQITDELQAMVWPDTGKVRRRSKGEELVKAEILKLIICQINFRGLIIGYLNNRFMKKAFCKYMKNNPHKLFNEFVSYIR